MDIKALRTEFTTLQTAQQTALDAVAAAKRDFTADEKTASEKSFGRMTEIKNVLEHQKKLAESSFSALKDPENATDPAAADKIETQTSPPGQAEQAAVEIRVGQTFENGRKKISRAEFAKHFSAWAREGRSAMAQKFATITSATDGNLLLPTEVDEPIIPQAANTIREALSIYGQKAMQTPTTRNITLPVADASAGGVVAESAGAETENEPALTASISLPVSTYQSGSTWFSNKELMAVDFDFMSAILPALAYSKELGLESAFFTAIIADAGITQTVAAATDGGFTYPNLVALNRILPKRYNALKVIFLSKDAYTAAENLVTTTGYPILNALDPQKSSLKYFNGTPVLWTDYLPTFGVAAKIGFVMSLVGFRLRDCGQEQVQRYTQYPGRPAQTGFNLYGYHAYGYASAALASLKTP